MTLSLVQEVLPPICAINSLASEASYQQEDPTKPAPNGNEHLLNGFSNDVTTTSQHYATIESDHPYKPAGVANYKVKISFR